MRFRFTALMSKMITVKIDRKKKISHFTVQLMISKNYPTFTLIEVFYKIVLPQRQHYSSVFVVQISHRSASNHNKTAKMTLATLICGDDAINQRLKAILISGGNINIHLCFRTNPESRLTSPHLTSPDMSPFSVSYT